MTSTSNDSAICSNQLITTVRRAVAKSAVKTALPVAKQYPPASRGYHKRISNV
jgi:hypothetical protein